MPDPNDPHGMYTDPALNPIRHLLTDPTVTQVMVNSPHEVYLTRNGQILPAEVTFPDEDTVLAAANALLNLANRFLGSRNPTETASLPNGLHVTAVHKTVAKHYLLTVTKPSRALDAADLIANGTLTPDTHAFLTAAVRGKANILITGGTAAGKTTLLNALCAAIPAGERLIAVEDTPELVFGPDAHALTMQTRPDPDPVSIRSLVRNAIRMRPDRIIVGECRNTEALEILLAMNTGQDGSMLTLRSSSPETAVQRLGVLIAQEGGIPADRIHWLIEDALDLIVTVERHPDGQRGVTDISEVRSGTPDDLQITRALWQTGTDRTLTKTVEPSRRLRRKLGLDAHAPNPIVGTTISTVGPVFFTPDTRPASDSPPGVAILGMPGGAQSFLVPGAEPPLTSEEARSTRFQKSQPEGYHYPQVEQFVRRATDALAAAEARETALRETLNTIRAALPPT